MEKNYLIKINLKHAQFQNDKQNAWQASSKFVDKNWILDSYILD